MYFIARFWIFCLENPQKWPYVCEDEKENGCDFLSVENKILLWFFQQTIVCQIYFLNTGQYCVQENKDTFSLECCHATIFLKVKQIFPLRIKNMGCLKQIKIFGLRKIPNLMCLKKEKWRSSVLYLEASGHKRQVKQTRVSMGNSGSVWSPRSGSFVNFTGIVQLESLKRQPKLSSIHSLGFYLFSSLSLGAGLTTVYRTIYVILCFTILLLG